MKKLFPKVYWVNGQGKYALLAPCGGLLPITLWKDLSEAQEELKGLICGGHCQRTHEIIDLETIEENHVKLRTINKSLEAHLRRTGGKYRY